MKAKKKTKIKGVRVKKEIVGIQERYEKIMETKKEKCTCNLAKINYKKCKQHPTPQEFFSTYNKTGKIL